MRDAGYFIWRISEALQMIPAPEEQVGQHAG
jgi:hypothetical protein